jgi:hypothetical protein
VKEQKKAFAMMRRRGRSGEPHFSKSANCASVGLKTGQSVIPRWPTMPAAASAAAAAAAGTPLGPRFTPAPAAFCPGLFPPIISTRGSAPLPALRMCSLWWALVLVLVLVLVWVVVWAPLQTAEEDESLL